MTTAPQPRALPDTLCGAIHRNCRCPRCYEGHAAWTRDRRNALADGTWHPWTHDLAPVLEHLDRLHDSGLSWTQIGRLAGVHRDQIFQIRTIRTFIRPSLAERLLAVQPAFIKMPPGAPMPSLGTKRRIQALRASGWPSQTLSRLAGVSVRSLNRALAEDTTAVSTAKRVAELYQDLHDQDPRGYGLDPELVQRGIRYGRRRNWAVPAAWTDIDTDTKANPRITAPRYARPKPGDRSRSVIEDTAELAALGLSRADIAERIGITWNAIDVTHSRAGKELPLALRQEAASEAALPDKSRAAA